jgi:hypothetical protein
VKLDLARRNSNPSARGLDRQGQPLLQARTVLSPTPRNHVYRVASLVSSRSTRMVQVAIWRRSARKIATLDDLSAAKVKVTVETGAKIPNGVADDLQRVINENCQTLRFRSDGFEQS